jgi:hypothetical protein
MITCTSFCGSLAAQENTTSESEANAGNTRLSLIKERFDVGEELIITFRVGRLNYGELVVIVGEDGLYINPQELISLLDFPINDFSSEDTYLLKGWFISDDRTFELTLFNEPNLNGVGEVIISNQRQYIPLSEYQEVGNERLINFDFIGKWFGLSFDFDVADQSVNATASIPLPAQSRLAREKRSLNDRGFTIPKHPNYDFGYFGRSHQIFDARVSTNFSNDNVNSFYSVVGVQDVAGFSSRFFFGGNDDDVLRNANLNIKKQSFDGNLLGFMQATTVEFGDIRPARVGNTSSNQDLGISVNNQKLGKIYNFEVTNITGVIQEGWDVELYHNGILIDKKINTQGGQYEFIDVQLFGELNTFEVVKYGPQGQVEKERMERTVDARLFDQMPRYNLSLTRSNSQLYSKNISNSVAQDWIFAGNYTYAFNRWMSSNFSHSINLSDSTKDGNYSLGSNFRLSPRVLLSTNLNYINSEQMGFGMSLRSRLFEQSLIFGLNASKSGDSINKGANVRVAGSLYRGDRGSLIYDNVFNGQWLSTGSYNYTFANTITFTNNFGYLTHNISKAVKKENDTEQFNSTNGSVTFGAQYGLSNFRLNASYFSNNTDEPWAWQNVTSTISHEFLKNLSSQVRYSRSIKNNSNTFSIGVDWREQSYALNALINHNSNGDTSFSVNARFSMSETPFGAGYYSSSQSLTSGGLVAVRVFEDVNQNFVFDENDRPISGATVIATQASKRAETDEYGIATIPSVGSFIQTDLNLDMDSLDDPYLLQSTISTSLTAREGLLTLINYPLVQGIEFEGVVSFSRGDKTGVPAKNALLIVLDQTGKTVKEIKTEFDGYFYSGILFPGIYTLKVADTYMSKNDLQLNQDITINAVNAGDFIPGIEVKLESLSLRDGYRVTLAKFENRSTAKVLLKMYLAQPKMQSYSNDLYIMKSKLDDLYHVGVKIFKTEKSAQDFCKLNSVFEICEVTKDRFFVLASMN